MPKAKAAANICVCVLQSASAAVGTSKLSSEPHLTIFALHQFRLRHQENKHLLAQLQRKQQPPRRSGWHPSQQGDGLKI
jgi:hypothetical protein